MINGDFWSSSDRTATSINRTQLHHDQCLAAADGVALEVGPGVENLAQVSARPSDVSSSRRLRHRPRQGRTEVVAQGSTDRAVMIEPSG